MDVLVVLFHYGCYEPLWEQPTLIQAGPNISDSISSINVPDTSIHLLKKKLNQNFPYQKHLLIHYTDPFYMRQNPLKGLKEWMAPAILACGDLHHGHQPISTLSSYLSKERHDAVILTFNPSLLDQVKDAISIPVNSLPPSFFRYPSSKKSESPIFSLIHIGSIGIHHQSRRNIINSLIQRKRIAFKHCNTDNAKSAAEIYSQHALALNIPLNQDLNHRFFEIMSAGIPQIIFGTKKILGAHLSLAQREDIFWASSILEIEEIANSLLTNKQALMAIKVAPTPKISIQSLIKNSLNC